MLGDKHRMSAHRGLLAVVRNARGRQPPGDNSPPACWSITSAPLISKQYCRSFTPRRKRERKVMNAGQAGKQAISIGTIRTPVPPQLLGEFFSVKQIPASEFPASSSSGHPRPQIAISCGTIATIPPPIAGCSPANRTRHANSAGVLIHAAASSSGR